MTSLASTASAALYYPAAIWTDGDWLKTALLFFDEVQLLRRDADHSPSTALDQDLLDLLTERKLIRVTEPASEIGDAGAERLRAVLQDKHVWDALDPIGAERRFYYGARVFSTLNGPEPSLEMMEMRNILMERLNAGAFLDQEVGGHAYPTYRVGGQQPSVPVHIRLWAPLMSVLPQYLRDGQADGSSLTPLTDHASGGEALARLLSLPGMPSAGRVQLVEPLPVAPDLSDLPWQDVLALRDELRADCSGFLDALRQAILRPDERERGAVEEAADVVRRRVSGVAGGRPLFHLGAVGARWREREAEESQLGTLARLLGGEGTEQSAVTAVFRSGHTIASAARPPR